MPASMPAVQARPCVPKQLVWLLSIPLVTFVHAAASQCTHGTDPLTSGSLTVSKFNAGAVGDPFYYQSAFWAQFSCTAYGETVIKYPSMDSSGDVTYEDVTLNVTQVTAQ